MCSWQTQLLLGQKGGGGIFCLLILCSRHLRQDYLRRWPRLLKFVQWKQVTARSRWPLVNQTFPNDQTIVPSSSNHPHTKVAWVRWIIKARVMTINDSLSKHVSLQRKKTKKREVKQIKLRPCPLYLDQHKVSPKVSLSRFKIWSSLNDKQAIRDYHFHTLQTRNKSPIES